MEDATPSPRQQCRLCLSVAAEQCAERLLDIHGDEDGDSNVTLTDKIRDCLGLYITPDDSIRKICRNCEQTINLIDEFRIFCRQTDEVYESVQIQPDDDAKWDIYHDHVRALRVLVQEQRSALDESLAGANLQEPEDMDDDLTDIFRPMPIKEEHEEEEDSKNANSEWANEIKPTDILQLKTEDLATTLELNDFEVFDPNSQGDSEPSSSQDLSVAPVIDNKFDLKLQLATEIEERLSLFTPNKQEQKVIWKDIGLKLGLSISETKEIWAVTKRSYRNRKKSAEEGRKTSIISCRSCPLFILCNKLVPALDGDEPWQDTCEDEFEEELTMSIDVKLAIAEEIRNNREVWDMSLASSGHIRETTWKTIAAKFDMDGPTLSFHWRRIQNIRRGYRVVDEQGIWYRQPKKIPHRKLIAVLQEIFDDKKDEHGEATHEIQAIDDAGQKNQDKDDDDEEDDAKEESEDEDIGLEEGEVEIVDREDDREEHSEAVNPFRAHRKKLALTKEVYGHEIIWCSRHPDFHTAHKRDKVWDKIATKFDVERDLVKREWKRLRDLFRGRYLRKMKGLLPSAHPMLNDPLYKELEKMFGSNMRVGSRGGRFSSEKFKSAAKATDKLDQSDFKFVMSQKIKLAELCYAQEIIWNNAHPHYHALSRRDAVWDNIASEMKLTRSKVKHEWRRLRGLYRGRYLRSLKGTNKIDEDDPLHRVLKKMLHETIHLGIRGGAQDILRSNNPTNGPRHFNNNDDKIRLVEEIAKQEVIWNVDHPDFNRAEKRNNSWKEIAKSFNCDPYILKTAWRRCRDFHRTRLDRAAKDQLDMSLVADDKLYQLMDRLMANEFAHEAAVKDEAAAIPRRKRKSKPSAPAVPKRRYNGKQKFNEEGCIKVDRNGTTRYEKICELCGKQIERSLFEYHMNMHSGLKPYTCSFEGCDRQYGNKTTRDRHEVMVHGEDGYKFECDQCGEKFKQRGPLEYHYAIKHKSLDVPCNICGKLLKHRNLLRDHLRLHGPNFTCSVCGKVLQKKYSLDVHMRTHTMEKPYPCELCGERFMLKVQMKTHLLKKHGMQWEEFQAAFLSVS